MTDETLDPLARVLTGLPRISPDQARGERIHARCARLYVAGAAKEPSPRSARGMAVAFGALSVLYLAELSLSIYRLIG